MDVPDMDVIREIPGYKVILKAVLKAQIQQLVEQLATTTSEESIILTASVADGTLSHLGSELAKGFLEDHEDVKSQFLGYCLKRQHKKEQEAEEKKRQEMMNSRLLASPPQHSYIPGPSRNTKAWPRGPGPGYPARGSIRSPGVRHEPYPQMSYPSPRASSSSAPATTVKQEPQDTSTDSFIDSEKVNQSKLCSEDDNQSNSANSTAGGSETDNDQSEHGAEVKVEASESDLELEITGVEPGTPAVSQSWSPGNMPFDSNIGATGTAADQQTQSKTESTEDHVCSYCGTSLKSLSGFQRHIKRHENKAPYRCCGKSFFDSIRLRMHRCSAHGQEGEEECAACGKKFATRQQLRQHKTLVHSDQTFKCSTCGIELKSKTSFNDHVSKHEGKKAHTCKICRRTYQYASSLYRHKKESGHI